VWLADAISICEHLDCHVRHEVKAMMSEIFGIPSRVIIYPVKADHTVP